MRLRIPAFLSRPRALVAIFFLLFLAAVAPSCSRAGDTTRGVLIIGFREGSPERERNSLLEYGCQRLEAGLGLKAELVIPGSGEEAVDITEGEETSLVAVLGCGEPPGMGTASSPADDPAPRLVCVDYPGGSIPPGGEGNTYIRYRVEEGAYLCGYLAGWLTRGDEHPLTNRLPVVAFIGCSRDPRAGWYQAGFARGAAAANPQVSLLSYLVDDFQVAGQARGFVHEAAKKGTDLVFCTPGAYQEEVVRTAESLDILVIVAGSDRPLASPSHVLTSLILRDDNAVFRAVDLTLKGDLEPGLQEWGIREGIWTLAPFRGHDVYISRDLKVALATEQEKVAGMDFIP
ncbi:MAG: BMP family ABC transporter substrate-binding protein [Actinomycetota bacterium]